MVSAQLLRRIQQRRAAQTRSRIEQRLVSGISKVRGESFGSAVSRSIASQKQAEQIVETTPTVIKAKVVQPTKVRTFKEKIILKGRDIQSDRTNDSTRRLESLATTFKQEQEARKVGLSSSQFEELRKTLPKIKETVISSVPSPIKEKKQIADKLISQAFFAKDFVVENLGKSDFGRNVRATNIFIRKGFEKSVVGGLTPGETLGSTFTKGVELFRPLPSDSIPKVVGKGLLFGAGTFVAEPFLKKPVQAAATTAVGLKVFSLLGRLGTPVIVGSIGLETVKAPRGERIATAATAAGAVAPFIAAGGLIKTAPLIPKIRLVTTRIPTEEGVIIRRGFGAEVGSRSILFAPERSKIELETLSKPVPAPVSSLETKLLMRSLALTPSETTRVESVIGSVRILKKDPGLKVKDVVFQIKEFQKPTSTSKIIEKFSRKNKGVIFGTATTLQLPTGFRVIPGDVDINFPTKTVAQLKPRVAKLAEQLNLKGENVRVSEDNPLNIESVRTGEKVIEIKSGIDQTSIAGEEPAPVGGLGFLLSERTVPFGKTRATPAGEQLKRKGIASIFFTSEGVLPKPKRDPKDISGFILSGKGLADIRSRSLSPLTRIGGRKAEKEIDTFFETFDKPKQAEIKADIRERLISREKIRFIIPPKSDPFKLIREIPTSSLTPLLTPRTIISTGSVGIQRSRSTRKEQLPKEVISPVPQRSPTRKLSPVITGLSPSRRGSPKIGSPIELRSPTIISPPLTPISPTILSPPPSKTPPSRSPPRSPPSRSPPRSPPSLSPPFSPPSKSPPFIPELEPSRSLTKKTKKGEIGFGIFIKRKGKFFRLGEKAFTKETAIAFGARETRSTLAATFAIRKVKGKVTKVRGFADLRGFREFKKVKGKRIPTPGTFIQRRATRLGTLAERKAIQTAKKTKVRFL